MFVTKARSIYHNSSTYQAHPFDVEGHIERSNGPTRRRTKEAV
jgi:hypothetical protein